MSQNNNLPAKYDVLNDLQIDTHGFLPIAAAYCNRIGLIDLINKLVPTEMDLSTGITVQAMVLDILSGRSPLYRVNSFIQEQDTELLLGRKVENNLFNDTNIGRVLDKIYNVGTSKILGEIGVNVSEIFQLDTSVISYDTTSTNVWGEYSNYSKERKDDAPKIVYGYSKDHRPDLKQFMTELLCVERGIPIFGKTLDGNSSDKTSNNDLLTNVSSLMAKHGVEEGAFIYVADSAMITEDNLEAIKKNLFVSRLPSTYNSCKDAVKEAIKNDDWVEIGQVAELISKSNKPRASYKFHETTVMLYGEEYRAIVMHSDFYDKRKSKAIDKKIEKSKKELCNKVSKTITIFSCEKDAQVAENNINKMSTSFHELETEIVTIETPTSGRIPKTKKRKMITKFELKYTIVEKSKLVEAKREEAGCFVLISNTPASGNNVLNGEQLLKIYKGQYGVENCFAFIKDPLIVNDTFLKKAERIDVLGMIIIIALTIWRLMERSLRAWVINNEENLPGWVNRKTGKPTTFMVSKYISGIQVAKTPDNQRFLLTPLNDRILKYLEALGLDNSVYTTVNCKCKPIIPKTLYSNKLLTIKKIE